MSCMPLRGLKNLMVCSKARSDAMRQLFVLDPLQCIQPAKDSSAALMQAAQRASIEVWACTPADLQARGDQLAAIAIPVVPEPWISTGEPQSLPLTDFACIWMRKDPPVDEAISMPPICLSWPSGLVCACSIGQRRCGPGMKSSVRCASTT